MSTVQSLSILSLNQVCSCQNIVCCASAYGMVTLLGLRYTLDQLVALCGILKYMIY